MMFKQFVAASIAASCMAFAAPVQAQAKPDPTGEHQQQPDIRNHVNGGVPPLVGSELPLGVVVTGIFPLRLEIRLGLVGPLRPFAISGR